MSNILLDMFRGHQDEPNEVLHKYVGSVLHVLHEAVGGHFLKLRLSILSRRFSKGHRGQFFSILSHLP